MAITHCVFFAVAVGLLFPLLCFADPQPSSGDKFPNVSGPFRYDSDGEAAGSTSIHDDWKLVWEDDFSKDSRIDPAKWNFEIDGKGGGNHELQYYTDSPKNARIENGELLITAIKNDAGHAFTSARMTTSSKFACQYGRIEALIKVPKAQQGNWPAFWMMPQDSVYGGWPRSGEIDIMEVVNQSDKLFGTCHYAGAHGDVHSGARAIFPGHNFSQDYHLYAVEWEPREIRWYVDNHYYGCITSWYTRSAAFPAPFDQKFFIILNYAVGGAWPKNPDATSEFPQSMHVKYVRVYQRATPLPAQTAAPAPAAFAVQGTPRLAHGHPSTLWDNQDVATYKAALKNNPAVKAAFDELQAWGDKRVAEPLNLPAYKLEQDGTWTFADFKRGYQDASGKSNWEWQFNTTLQQRTADVSNLGMLYALTGDEKYAAFARQILLGLADAYGYGKGAPDPNGYDHFGAYGFDGGDAGMFLAKACHGNDLIYNSLSAEDRAHIERDLIRPMAEHLEKTKFMYSGHGRWGMVCLYGVFIAGATLDDQPMLDLALYGEGGTKDNVTGGFMDCFSSDCLHDGVVWGEDTKILEQMAAVCVLTTVAEVMWHRGVELYDYNDMAMKKAFDAALAWVANGDVSKLLGLPGIDAYEYAYRRYQDPRYLPIVRMLKPDFTLAIGEALPCCAI